MTVENAANAVNLVGMARRNYSDIRYIVLHHSGTPNGNVAIFRDYHIHHNGWRDVGYHYVITNGNGGNDGEVQEGRHLLFTGAHAPGRNKDSVGVCLVGDFLQGKPTSAQMSALYRLIEELMQKYPIVPDRILAHKEVRPTDCPGNLDVGAIRAALSQKSSPKIRIGSIELDGIVVEGRVYAPVRALVDALNCHVDWDEATRTVHITQGGR